MILQVWWCHSCHLDQYNQVHFSTSYNPNVPGAAQGMWPMANGHRFRDGGRGKTANLTTQPGQGTEHILRNFRERQNLCGNVFVYRLVGQVAAGSEHQRSIFTHEICSAPSVPGALPAWPGPASWAPSLPWGEGTDPGGSTPASWDTRSPSPGPRPLPFCGDRERGPPHSEDTPQYLL